MSHLSKSSQYYSNGSRLKNYDNNETPNLASNQNVNATSVGNSGLTSKNVSGLRDQLRHEQVRQEQVRQEQIKGKQSATMSSFQGKWVHQQTKKIIRQQLGKIDFPSRINEGHGSLFGSTNQDISLNLLFRPSYNK